MRGLMGLLLLCLLQSQASATIVTTIPPLQFLAMAVAGEEVDVLLGPQDDPHHLNLSPSDRISLDRAELIVWLDPRFEVELGEFLSRETGAARRIAVTALSGLTLHDLSSGELDPHVWLDPDNALLIAEQIARDLQAIRPNRAGQYADNLARLRSQLSEANSEIEATFAQASERRYVVYHDAYRYFESYFGLGHELALVRNPEVTPGMREILQVRQQVAGLQPHCVLLDADARDDLVDTMVEGSPMLRRRLDPMGLAIEPGQDAFLALLHEVAAGFRDCLYP